MKKRNWKIIYSDFTGAEKKAAELINRELGALILRENGIFTIYTLAVEHISEVQNYENAVIIGKYDENSMVRKFIRREEIPEGGYAVKVTDNPDNPDFKLVIITAETSEGVFYGATDFVDDYFVKAVPVSGPIRLADEIFEHHLCDYFSASAPVIKTRTVFLWGHVINDFRKYIDNLARLRFNQMIIWNDFLPVNAKEVVDYAHEYGIKIMWGFAWGWSRNCLSADVGHLEEISDSIVKEYEKNYKGAGDGIYFQSFTETEKDEIDGIPIADAVCRLVNMTAQKILEKEPGLHIQFGLHATSVKDSLGFIAKTDSRVEIIWEDCGAFPYAYMPVSNDEEYKEAVNFTDKMLALRGGVGCGMLYKGLLTMDWNGDRFAHQSGRYILGCSHERTAEEDKRTIKPMWRHLQSEWFRYGFRVYDMTRYIAKEAKKDVTLGIVGMLEGGIWFPEALCARILWNCNEEYEKILDSVAKYRCLEQV